MLTAFDFTLRDDLAYRDLGGAHFDRIVPEDDHRARPPGCTVAVAPAT